MTVELSAVLPRICFACVVGLIFFLILRSELNNWSKTNVTENPSESTERISDRSSVVARVKRYVLKSLNVDPVGNADNTTDLNLLAVVIDENGNITAEIQREIEENRLQTDFLFWLVLGTAFLLVTLVSVLAASCLLQSGASLVCFSRSRAHRDPWWETKDEDFTNYDTFMRQTTKLIEDIEPIDGAVYVEPNFSPAPDQRRSRHLSTIDENGEISDAENNYKRTKRIVKTEYTLDLTAGVNGTYIIPTHNEKSPKIWKPQMISLVYSAPDFRRSGMPCVCIPAE